MGNCIQPIQQQPKQNWQIIEHSIRMKKERDAFNTVNRNFNLNQQASHINEAALNFLNAYGDLPPTSFEHEVSARRVFVKMVSAKAAYMAAVEFDNAVRIYKDLMPNESGVPDEM